MSKNNINFVLLEGTLVEYPVRTNDNVTFRIWCKYPNHEDIEQLIIVPDKKTAGVVMKCLHINSHVLISGTLANGSVFAKEIKFIPEGSIEGRIKKGV